MAIRQNFLILFSVLLAAAVVLGFGIQYVIQDTDADFSRRATPEELRDYILARDAIVGYGYILANQATVAGARAKSADPRAGQFATLLPDPVPIAEVNCDTIEGADLCNDIKVFCDANGTKPGVCCGCTSKASTCSIGCY